MTPSTAEAPDLDAIRRRLKLSPESFAVVVSGPSGVGKSTICQALEASDHHVRYCVTTTTRPRRDGEVDGRHRHFVSDADFQAHLDNGDLVEWAEVHGQRYGATVDAVNEAMAGGNVMLLDIDVQGADSWKRVLGDRCVRVFILPPSIEELGRRLEDRRSEEKESFERRMKAARNELSRAPDYDYVLVNARLQDAVDELKAVLTAERQRTHRQKRVLDALSEKGDDRPE